MPERQRLIELALKGLEADRTRLEDEIIQIKRELKMLPTPQQARPECRGLRADRHSNASTDH
jgi:hypothetical protein